MAYLPDKSRRYTLSVVLLALPFIAILKMSIWIINCFKHLIQMDFKESGDYLLQQNVALCDRQQINLAFACKQISINRMKCRMYLYRNESIVIWVKNKCYCLTKQMAMNQYGAFSFDVARQWIKNQLKVARLAKQDVLMNNETKVLPKPKLLAPPCAATEVFKGTIVELEEKATRVGANGRLYETCALTLEDDDKITRTLVGYELSRVIEQNHLQVGDRIFLTRQRRESSSKKGNNTYKRYKNHYTVEKITD